MATISSGEPQIPGGKSLGERSDLYLKIPPARHGRTTSYAPSISAIEGQGHQASSCNPSQPNGARDSSISSNKQT